MKPGPHRGDDGDLSFYDLDSDRELPGDSSEAINLPDKKVDADFFNNFDDDFDEQDMKLE